MESSTEPSWSLGSERRGGRRKGGRRGKEEGEEEVREGRKGEEENDTCTTTHTQAHFSLFTVWTARHVPHCTEHNTYCHTKCGVLLEKCRGCRCLSQMAHLLPIYGYRHFGGQT